MLRFMQDTHVEIETQKAAHKYTDTCTYKAVQIIFFVHSPFF